MFNVANTLFSTCSREVETKHYATASYPSEENINNLLEKSAFARIVIGRFTTSSIRLHRKWTVMLQWATFCVISVRTRAVSMLTGSRRSPIRLEKKLIKWCYIQYHSIKF